MKTEHPQLYIESAEKWRKWLSENGHTQKGVWLIYYKKHTGKPRVAYNDAVEEALCYGWIDSTVKRIDDERYMQQFTPRNERSNWSDLNKKRLAKLTELGKMMPAGLKSVGIAKENGKWYEPDRPQTTLELSPDLYRQLKKYAAVMELYNQLAASHRKQFNNWVMGAKKEETQQKRFSEMISMLEKGEKPGMK